MYTCPAYIKSLGWTFSVQDFILYIDTVALIRGTYLCVLFKVERGLFNT